ncbi:MAG: S-adenosylmethionine decarboxylase [Candidatus Zixiibacteriota bacterium]|nr:MAG: S-adenosylmethionine decarboxylase [candidate division Zixibacteria bacterium]
MIKDIAPDIYRQRLLIEGYYSINIDRKTVEEYLLGVAKHLGLKTYGEPVIFSPAGEGKTENQGFDAFVPLVDSGISTYIWEHRRFFSVFLYTCRQFDVQVALDYTGEFFQVDGESVCQSF